jgi:hypothetical protein
MTLSKRPAGNALCAPRMHGLFELLTRQGRVGRLVGWWIDLSKSTEDPIRSHPTSLLRLIYSALLCFARPIVNVGLPGKEKK